MNHAPSALVGDGGGQQGGAETGGPGLMGEREEVFQAGGEKVQRLSPWGHLENCEHSHMGH